MSRERNLQRNNNIQSNSSSAAKASDEGKQKHSTGNMMVSSSPHNNESSASSIFTHPNFAAAAAAARHHPSAVQQAAAATANAMAQFNNPHHNQHTTNQQHQVQQQQQNQLAVARAAAAVFSNNFNQTGSATADLSHPNHHTNNNMPFSRHGRSPRQMNQHHFPSSTASKIHSNSLNINNRPSSSAESCSPLRDLDDFITQQQNKHHRSQLFNHQSSSSSFGGLSLLHADFIAVAAAAAAAAKAVNNTATDLPFSNLSSRTKQNLQTIHQQRHMQQQQQDDYNTPTSWNSRSNNNNNAAVAAALGFNNSGNERNDHRQNSNTIGSLSFMKSFAQHSRSSPRPLSSSPAAATVNLSNTNTAPAAPALPPWNTNNTNTSMNSTKNTIPVTYTTSKQKNTLAMNKNTTSTFESLAATASRFLNNHKSSNNNTLTTAAQQVTVPRKFSTGEISDTLHHNENKIIQPPTKKSNPTNNILKNINGDEKGEDNIGEPTFLKRQTIISKTKPSSLASSQAQQAILGKQKQVFTSSNKAATKINNGNKKLSYLPDQSKKNNKIKVPLSTQPTTTIATATTTTTTATPFDSKNTENLGKQTIDKKSHDILMEWVNQNSSHPFINTVERNQLAQKANLQPRQVTSWLNSFRRRRWVKTFQEKNPNVHPNPAEMYPANTSAFNVTPATPSNTAPHYTSSGNKNTSSVELGNTDMNSTTKNSVPRIPSNDPHDSSSNTTTPTTTKQGKPSKTTTTPSQLLPMKRKSSSSVTKNNGTAQQKQQQPAQQRRRTRSQDNAMKNWSHSSTETLRDFVHLIRKFQGDKTTTNIHPFIDYCNKFLDTMDTSNDDSTATVASSSSSVMKRKKGRKKKKKTSMLMCQALVHNRFLFGNNNKNIKSTNEQEISSRKVFLILSNQDKLSIAVLDGEFLYFKYTLEIKTGRVEKKSCFSPIYKGACGCCKFDSIEDWWEKSIGNAKTVSGQASTTSNPASSEKNNNVDPSLLWKKVLVQMPENPPTGEKLPCANIMADFPQGYKFKNSLIPLHLLLDVPAKPLVAMRNILTSGAVEEKQVSLDEKPTVTATAATSNNITSSKKNKSSTKNQSSKTTSTTSKSNKSKTRGRRSRPSNKITELEWNSSSSPSDEDSRKNPNRKKNSTTVPSSAGSTSSTREHLQNNNKQQLLHRNTPISMSLVTQNTTKLDSFHFQIYKRIKYQTNSYLSLRKDEYNIFQQEYPHAPLGQIWQITAQSQELQQQQFILPGLNSGGSFLGRKWVWDEGHFIDENISIGLLPSSTLSLSSSSGGGTGAGAGAGGANSTNNGKTNNDQQGDKTSDGTGGATGNNRNCYTPLSCRAYCNCGQGGLTRGGSGKRLRRGATGGYSVKLDNVLSELASGKLNSHTLISCENYALGFEYESVVDVPGVDISEKDPLLGLIKEKNGSVQPFNVRVSPDALFMADLHAHLADCEVIGLFGGRYVEEEKCLYIQVAFPCKAANSGSTDVEMDAVSQVMARDYIATHGMNVVGWYHSHPTFQPDPSVTDIENQGNYQRLFVSNNNQDNEHTNRGRSGGRGDDDGGDSGKSSGQECPPFVGLIIGTWDGRNPTPRSVMRWFHVVPKETGNRVNPSRYKAASERSSRIIDYSVSNGTANERVLFPMKLTVTHRRYRQKRMLLDNKQSRTQLTEKGQQYRAELLQETLQFLRIKRVGDINVWENRQKKYLMKIPESHQLSTTKNNIQDLTQGSFFCQEIPQDNKKEEGKEGNDDSVKNAEKNESVITTTGEEVNNKLSSTHDKHNNMKDSSDGDEKDIKSGTKASSSTSTVDFVHHQTIQHQFDDVDDEEIAVMKNAKDQQQNLTSSKKSNNINHEESSTSVKLQIPGEPLAAFTYSMFLTQKSFRESSLSLPPGEKQAQQVEEKTSSSKKEKESNVGTLFSYSSSSSSNIQKPDQTHQKGIICIADFNLISENKKKKTSKNSRKKINKNALKDVTIPLPFTNDEMAILTDNISSNEEKSEVIWNAVEREQFDGFGTSTSWALKRRVPASSTAILKLLLKQGLTTPPFIESNLSQDSSSVSSNNTNIEFSSFAQDDIALIHGIDALLSHYASSSNRVKIEDTWTSAGPFVSGGGTSGEKNKNSFKKGQKLCASLLPWARDMQLGGVDADENSLNKIQDYRAMLEEINNHNDGEKDIINIDTDDEDYCNTARPTTLPDRDNSHSTTKTMAPSFTSLQTLRWSHEEKKAPTNLCLVHDQKTNKFTFQKVSRKNNFCGNHKSVFFTAEIMRLIAARWREANNESKSNTSSSSRSRDREHRSSFSNNNSNSNNNRSSSSSVSSSQHHHAPTRGKGRPKGSKNKNSSSNDHSKKSQKARRSSGR